MERTAAVFIRKVQKGIKTTEFKVSGKSVTIYPAHRSDAPLILLNIFSGDGSSVVRAMAETGCADCCLVSVGDLNWDHDMTPWYCPPLSPDDSPCTGGADEYLKVLLEEILPGVLSRISGSPVFLGIAGYSLAGLFALYSMYRTDCFRRVASMSGSLWFPDFKEYAQKNDLIHKPERLYLSLGDREAKTRNPMLKTVQDNTEFLAGLYRDMGISVKYELNPGNHFRDEAFRTVKGIKAILM